MVFLGVIRDSLNFSMRTGPTTTQTRSFVKEVKPTGDYVSFHIN